MNGQPSVRVELDEIRLGAACKFDICDDNGLLLLGRGQPLTAPVRDQILRRSVSYIEVHPDDVVGLTGADVAPRQSQSKSQPVEVDSRETFQQRQVDRRDEPYSNERAQRFRRMVIGAVDSLTQFGEQIQSLSQRDVSALCDISQEMTGMALEDPDQSIATLNELTDLTVAQRCTRMSLLAMNTGIELDLPGPEIIYLGTAALLHDMGLFLLPESYRDPTATLSSDDAWAYRKHPTIAMDLFAKYSAVPDEIRAIMNQVHERVDGSGYPRGLHVNLIHPLARVLNVVDTYLSLIDPGPGRPAILPHDAMGFLLYEGGRGRFDASPMRAFLSTMTLFPIGSRVELNDGREATVIRRDADHYTQPIVCVDEEPESEEEGETFAIHDSPHSIARPLLDKSKRQMRIMPETMTSLTLDMFQPSC